MNLARLIHEVDIRRESASTTDRYGNAVSSDATETTYSAFVDQSGTSEDLGDRDTRMTTFLLILPDWADIIATDTVVWDSDSYRVLGKPHRSYNGGRLDHIECTIELLEG